MKTDREIQREVMAELNFDPSVRAEQIGVAVKDQVVTLTGGVPTYAEKSAAENAAFRVAGVKAVVEGIQVNIPGAESKSDAEIAKVAADALAWHTSLTSPIRVIVENGTLTLRGEVDWDYQRNAAHDSVRVLSGVKGVNNFMSVRKRVVPVDVKNQIEKALMRIASQKAFTVKVETIGGKVILSGTVQTREEAENMRRSAWAVPGVESVESHLSIS